MLTAKRAFPGDDLSETLAAVIKSEPDWNALPESVPAPIRAVVRHCLQKDRRDRVGDVSTALFVIRNVRESAETAAPKRRATPAFAAAVFACVLTGVSVWVLTRRPEAPARVVRFAITFVEQNFESGFNHVAAISPDGGQIVYFAGDHLYRRSVSDAVARPIPGVESSFDFHINPVFSPDGRSIAFWAANNPSSGEIRRVSLDGGAPITLAQAVRPDGMSWTGDTILIGQIGTGILRVPANGGMPDVVVRAKPGETLVDPQLLPGGDAVLFTLATGFTFDTATPENFWDKAKVVVQTLKTGTRKIVIDGGSAARYLSTGHLVYAVGTTLLAVPFDLKQQKTIGAPTSVLDHVKRGVVAGLSTGSALFDVSDSGSLIYIPASSSPVSSADRALALIDRGGGMEMVKLAPGRYEAPRISPDGKHVAFDIDDGKEASVWVADLTGTRSPLRITFAGQNRLPIWSPDGQRLTFQSDRDGDRGIYWQRADGSGTAERLTKADLNTSHDPGAWSPAGDVLLYSVRNETAATLWTLSIADRKTALFGDRSQPMYAPTPAFSRDGRWVAYSAAPNGLSVVFVQPFPATGAKYQISKEPDSHHPVWSPDGKDLIYLSGDVKLTSVSVTTQPSFVFGNPARVTSANEGAGTDLPFNPRNYDVTPDGKRFIRVVDADAATRNGPLPNPILDVVLNWSEELKQRVPLK
jgi:serine/threonine-protein kinase